MAPELYDKMDKMTMFSDRYAFGITLWELFALAERPFGKKSPAEVSIFTTKSQIFSSGNLKIQCRAGMAH